LHISNNKVNLGWSRGEVSHPFHRREQDPEIETGKTDLLFLNPVLFPSDDRVDRGHVRPEFACCCSQFIGFADCHREAYINHHKEKQRYF
jgi:hypothetical protein